MMETVPTTQPPEVLELIELPPEERLDRLIEFLGSSGKRKIAVATHVLTGLGSVIITRLLREAFARGRRPTHALRLLNIVGLIGGPVCFDDWMLISAGRMFPNKLVRARCAALFMQVGHAVQTTPAVSDRPHRGNR